jgi:glucose/arabinose dehydrogenase
LVVSRAGQSVVALWDDDGDGVSGPSERTAIANAPDLAHGLALEGGYLYASNASTVYRFDYTAPREELPEGMAVITDIPAGGNHTSRTLLFDDTYLYVTVGSASNVDADSSRSRIHRFPIAQLDPDEPLAFSAGELFADGLRNEVGIALDPAGRVWGVENGRDELQREDLGGDIHLDNPGEELNLFAEPGLFYGYPYCWSEGVLPDAGLGAATQWADPDNTTYDDEWCRDPDNVVPPALVMQAHTAPLDLLFYSGTSFPQSYVGDALVTLHGSWNRPEEAAVGYKVVRIPFGDDGMPSGEVVSLFEYAGPGDRPVGEAQIAAEWPIRPVGLTLTPDGTLLVSSDASNEVIAIGYQP